MFMSALADRWRGVAPAAFFSCCPCCHHLLQPPQGNAYYAVPVLVSPKTQLDVVGASEFTTAKLQVQQRLPCLAPVNASAAPAFCSEFAQPAVCAADSYAYAADGGNVPQCAGAGASMALNVLNPQAADTCTAGTLPNPQYATDLDAMWALQMPVIGGYIKGVVTNTSASDATQAPKVGNLCWVVVCAGVLAIACKY